jgi:hypothetical protein
MGIVSQSFIDAESTNREQRKHTPGVSADIYDCVVKVGIGAEADTVIPREGDYGKLVGITVPVGDTALKLGPFVAKDGISYGQERGEGNRTVRVRFVKFNKYGTY